MSLRSWARQFFTANQLHECFQPLFYVTYFQGLTPFYIKQDPNGIKRLKNSVFGYINALFHIIMYGACYALTLVNNCESVVGYFFRTRVSYVGDFMQVLSGFIGVTVIYISAIVPKHRLEKVLTLYCFIDDQLKDIGVEINYSKIYRYAYGLMISLLILNSVYIVGCFELMKSVDIRPSMALYVTFVLQHSVLSVAMSLYSCVTRTLEMRIVMLNQVLKNLSNQWENRKIRSISAKSRSLNCLDSFSMYTIVTKNPCEIIHESMEIHHLICEAASTANKYFTYQLLTIISIAFLIIVFDAYYVLETLLGKSKRESKFKTVEFVTFFSCQMILYLIAIISIVEGSNRAIKKSEQTGGIVHGLLNKAKSPDVKEKLQQFSMQLMHLKINFTAAGLFNIDRTLYFTISGALTTYLIILLQFTSSAPNGSVPCSFGQNGNITAIGNATIAPNN
ncbi:putative gustatory receptor 28b isoform X1 [Eupeodes corollae]|uniref:putative gustatory receptor 28b isoform X1 n=1 Tax=Eupeodes corollae TaxID=290404 RepID=UPI0024918AD5|nr:putative gustatory receptor 28b isoform X1 [Eupeodes corollae]